MAVIRSIKDRANPYVQINKNVFDDPLLSLKAKGFIGYCLSKPDNWIFHVEQLCKVLKEKETSIYNVIKECIDHGYAIRWRKRSASGVFEPWQTVISDSKEEIQKIKKELNTDRSIQSSFSLEFKNKVPHPGFPDVDNPDVENQGLIINDSSKNEDTNIIATPEPDIPKPPPTQASSMPAGGNNNFFRCLEKCIDLSPKQKRLLMKFPEPLVEQAVRYAYHSTTEITGGPIGRIKLLQYFLNNPEEFAETMKNLDNPQPKLSKKEVVVSRFKKGELYNGFEFSRDEIGVSFNKSGMMQAYSVDWKEPNFVEEFIKLLKKCGIKQE